MIKKYMKEYDISDEYYTQVLEEWYHLVRVYTVSDAKIKLIEYLKRIKQ